MLKATRIVLLIVFALFIHVASAPLYAAPTQQINESRNFDAVIVERGYVSGARGARECRTGQLIDLSDGDFGRRLQVGHTYHFENAWIYEGNPGQLFFLWYNSRGFRYWEISGCPSAPAPSAPPSISFFADPSSITAGQCTTLRWDVENVRAVYLDGQGVIGHDSKSVCPLLTTTYTLRVVTNSGDFFKNATVNVSLNLDSQPADPSAQIRAELGEFRVMMTDADYESLVEFMRYATDTWKCISYAKVWKAAGIITTTPDAAKSCGGMVNEIVTVLSKYISPRPVYGDREAGLDLDTYCAYEYGSGAYVVMGDRWDAYSWRCYRGNQYLGGIDMDRACRKQHPDLPNAIMLDRWDAFSWVCR